MGGEKTDKLTPKQAKFVEEYLLDLNATQAAIRAGYKPKMARFIGCENLTKPNIAEAIQEQMEARSKRTEISQDRVLQEYAKLAFLDPRKFFDEQGRLRDIHDLDDDTAAAIAGMDIATELTGKNTEGEPTVSVVRKIKLVDKKGALDSVARHLGMFNDKLALSGEVKQRFEVVFPDGGTLDG